ncbi:MAG: hypothetical protein H6573_10740 [Lewinellaceae bacterium]|nr:hypothetical protein [Lewinellaceae bacterium]
MPLRFEGIQKFFLSTLILAAPLWLSAQPCTDESEYTAVWVAGEVSTSLALPGPGSVEGIFGAAATAVSARSLTLTPGLISPYYVDNVWRIGFRDETGMPVVMPGEVELNFPTNLQTGDAVMDVPVVAIRSNGQVSYTLGTPHSGKLLTSAGAVFNPEYNTVSLSGVGAGASLAVFGCPSCGPKKVQICQVPPATRVKPKPSA